MAQPASLPPAAGPTTPTFPEVVTGLIRYLERCVPRPEQGHQGDRGALAVLRRAAGHDPGEALEAAAIVFRYAPDNLKEAQREALFTVGTLFALHPVASWPGGDSRSPRDFGAHLRAIRYRPDAAGRSREDEDAGVERRFAALLDASREALPHHLRHLVRLLDDRAPEAGIDYRQLAIDITKWDDPDRNVQVRWARGFWSWRPGDATENTGAVPGAADQEPKDNGNEEE